jgi:hypothetical protein
LRALACSFILLGLGAAFFAAPVWADDQEQKPEQSAAQEDKHKVDDLWARLPLHIHSARDIRRAHAHTHATSDAVIPQYTLHSSFGYVSCSGPFPVQPETHTAVAFTVHDATRGQFSVEFDRDTELGLLDRSAGAAFRVPLTPMLSLTGAAKFSADGAVNPVNQFSLAPSYTLFFVPQGQMFGALSVSVQGSHYRTADAFTVNPMFSFGSLASGVTFSVAYTFGNLYDAQPTATFLSLGQATITTGPSLSFNWTVNPQFTLALSFLPKNETVTLFSTSTETSARASASYRFSQGPRLGFAVQYMDTTSPLSDS